MLILSESDLRAVLSMRDVIDALEQGFRAIALGEASIPDRLHLDLPSRGGVLLEMPACVVDSDGDCALGTKIVSVFEGNASRGLEIVQASYLLLDGQTGVPLAFMEGRFITAIRTAATSALATRFMAGAGKKHLAVFGAGVQARFHIEAMIAAAEVVDVTISSRSAAKARALGEHVTSVYKLPCEVVSANEAAAVANLICTCTSSPAPLFEGRLLKSGTHVNAVGAFTPATRELDTETVRRSRVIIDAESAAGREAGDILIAMAEGAVDPNHVKGTLADVVSGKTSGRESASEITLFKSCGLAVEDLVTARLAYSTAIERAIGTNVDL